jgi:hypothetical protein
VGDAFEFKGEGDVEERIELEGVRQGAVGRRNVGGRL